MKIIDLFAGAGGLSEGFRRNGFEIVAHVEADTNAANTLKTREAYYFLKEKGMLDTYYSYLNGSIDREKLYKMIPQDVIEKVINEFISEETFNGITRKIDELKCGNSITGIIGGPPCQAYSLAGRSRDKFKMKNDPRNFLYIQYLKFIEKYMPKFFVFENVQGLLSAHDGKTFENIQCGMKNLGYTIDYQLLNSKDFGVLQNRKRIIIIGWRNDVSQTYPIFEKIKNSFTIRDLFADLPHISAGEEAKTYLKEPNVCMKMLKIRTEDDILTYHKSRKNRELDLSIYRKCVRYFNENQRNMKYNELPPELITHNNNRSFLDRFKVVPFDDVSHTVVAHISKDGHHYIHPDLNQNRSLSIREAARIQSFPDDFYFESSQTHAFQQIGNAVPPLMADVIAAKILSFLE